MLYVVETNVNISRGAHTTTACCPADAAAGSRPGLDLVPVQQQQAGGARQGDHIVNSDLSLHWSTHSHVT